MEQTIYKENLNKLAKTLKPFINGINDEEYQEIVNKTLKTYRSTLPIHMVTYVE